MPLATSDLVDVCCFVLVSVCINFAIFAEESSLIEGVLVRHASCLGDLVHLSVEQVR